MPDEFVEALGVELFSLGTDAGFSGLFGEESFVEVLGEHDDVCFGGRSAQDAFDVELLLVFGVLSGREDRVEDVFDVGGRDVLALGFVLAALAHGRDDHGFGVLDERALVFSVVFGGGH